MTDSFYYYCRKLCSIKIPRGIKYQERAEYGGHLLSDFLFPHVVSQIFIIRFHDIRSWY